jgi:hypothetical protein
MYSTGFLYAFRIRFFRNRIDKTKKYDQYLIQEYFLSSLWDSYYTLWLDSTLCTQLGAQTLRVI